MKRYRLRGAGGGRALRIDYEAELNEAQRAVVFAGEGPILVIAGAGSGKTRTLTYRLARLVEAGIPASSILLLTFTNKAAREMLQRAAALLDTDTRGIIGGTFHHVGHLVVRRYGDLLGYDRNSLTILDRPDARELLDSVISSRRELLRHRKFPKADVIEDVLSYSINTGTALEAAFLERAPVFGEILEPIRDVVREYQERKRRHQYVDFDDLLVLWRRLVREFPDVRQALDARFRHVLVDEFQDTNRLQAEIVETITGPEGNLMVVGDDAQSIYSFRGANFGNIIDFPKRFPCAQIFRLETNYRSTPEILRLANSSIRHNARQFPKVLRAVRSFGPAPEVASVGTPTEQAWFVVERILDLREEGYELGDMAVLYRAHWHSMELQIELQQRGIPFQVRSGVRFFEQAHIKDVLAHLRLVVNPRDEISWKRVLKQITGVGRATADKVWQRLQSEPDPVAAVLAPSSGEWFPRAARPGWSSFRRLYTKLREPGLERAPAQAIQTVLDGGYAELLPLVYPNPGGRMEDLRRLMDYARRFDSVRELIDQITVTTPVAGEEALEEMEPTEVLVLSTVHQAKGLEWRAVFVIWLVEGKMPDARAVAGPGGEEEERRLFYVACTRAKDRLFLVHPSVSDERGRFFVPQRRSRFLEELDPAAYVPAEVVP